MSVGLPYAIAEIDGNGNLYNVCPVCGLHCYPEGDRGYADLEDNVTKGAAYSYGFHYTREHE